MRERGPADEVADRPHAGAGGAQRAVHLHEPPLVELDARLAEPEPLDVGAAAGGDHEVVDLGPLLAVGEADRVLADAHVRRRGARVDLDALALEAALDQPRDVGVLGRQHALERLEQQHLAAQPRERRGDLRARGARARRPPGARAPPRSAHASSVPITRPPNSTPGIARGTEPVARTTPCAPNDSPPTRTEPSRPQRRRRPRSRRSRVCLNSPPTPEVSVDTTLSPARLDRRVVDLDRLRA